ncbi:MAG: AMP-binding protein [Luminiphilus sp.]|nr:AMP-binding protein [Luminiphilus sp.]
MSAPATHTAELLEFAAAKWGHRRFVCEEHFSLTFAQLLDNVRWTAAALLERGAEAGTCVAIWAPNRWEWIVGALATHYIGGTLVTLNTRYRGSEAAQILRRSGVQILITAGTFLDTDYPALLDGQDCGDLLTSIVLDEPGPDGFAALLQAGRAALSDPQSPVSQALAAARDRVSEDDLSDILFTSGTTGTPKGVMTTHSQNLRAFAVFVDLLGLDDSDRYLIINPFFHSFGYKAGWLACLLVGAEAHPIAVFDVNALIKTIGARQITCMPGPPTLFHSILMHPELDRSHLTSLAKATTGAAVIPQQLIDDMRSVLGIDTVITAYGLSEACGLVTMCRRGDDTTTIARTSGRAIPDVEVSIVNESGEHLSAGDTGEIVVRGYNLMQGYLNDPLATEQTIDREGWLHTGDIGALDEQGNLSITDRLKDMYISGGFNCYPAEIEQLLIRHPDISQAAVVAQADDRMGEVGVAFIVASDAKHPDGQEIMAWCRNKMANYKVPREIRWSDALPLNASGKVLKTTLREML